MRLECQTTVKLRFNILRSNSFARNEVRVWKTEGFSPSLCGVLVFDSVSRSGPAASADFVITHSLSHNFVTHHRLCHHTPSFTHNFVTHHLSHTTLSHTLFHTQLCHTPSFTHNFVIHSLSHTTTQHTQLCHTPSFDTTIFHTQLCHTLSFTHNYSAHTTMSHTIFRHNNLSHTTLSYTLFHTQLLSTHNYVTHHLSTQQSFTHNFVIHSLSHTTTQHTQLCHTPSFDTTIFHTQLCHTPSIFHTWRHLPSSCLAGVALGDIDFRFAWQAWHIMVWHWAGSGGALGAPWSRGDAAALCVAGVALGDIDVSFAWQAWDLVTSTIVVPGMSDLLTCLMETLAKHSGMFTETLGVSHA